MPPIPIVGGPATHRLFEGSVNDVWEGLRLPVSLQQLVRGRFSLHLMRGARERHGVSMSFFYERVVQALDTLTPDVWICTFRDTTSTVI